MTQLESPSISILRRGAPVPEGDPDRTVVILRGEHDTANRNELAAAFVRASELDTADVVLDLSDVVFMDAATIGAIIGGANLLRSLSRTLEVRAPSSMAASVLEMCGLGHLEHLHGTIALHPAAAGAALGTWVAVPSTPAATAATRRAVDSAMGVKVDHSES